ncbi:transporter substrate-binding domain-containing protein [Bosea sp. (in: a-proteobacteria)]|uniref:transporter substrate-binding domain-containing protein n=1 Tax=Bosea sp. (in: a-proteobacteria) TaxID=1871050 RepID=UPI00261F1A9E|nr:transporter substrate-binding domain-containing protein [Bosea sp. (in: a-proteobacteria)]MCO5089843.1 transporter substrate-binding domain-containing protein [Bosea sp. (in: a-proteobacteria)]
MITERLTKIATVLAIVLGTAGYANAQSVTVAGVEITKDAALAALLPEKYREKGLRAEFNPPQPPFSMIDDAGKPYGLLIDFGNAIAARLGTTLTLGRVTHDSIIPALQAGNYDFMLGTDADTEARQKMVNLVNYMGYGVSLVVKEGNPQNLKTGKDLCGKRLAVLKGWSPPNYFDSLSVDCKARGLPAVNITTLPNTPDTILAVRSGASDATFVSTPTALGATKAIEGGKVMVVSPKEAPLGWNTQLHGLLVLKQNEELTKALSATVNSLLVDGTLKKLFQQYGLAENMLLDKVIVNQALPDTGLN